MQSDNVYITGLPVECTSDMVKQVFSQYGSVVQCKVLTNPSPHPTDSAALVRFAGMSEATGVVESLNGKVPAGLASPVRVSFATGGGGKGGGGGGDGYSPTPRPAPYAGGGGGGAEPEASDNIYVKGLPLHASEDSIMQDFAGFGTVVSVKCLDPPAGSQSKAALVRFTSAGEAQHVKQSLNGLQPEGFPEALTIRFANQKGGGKGGKGGAPSFGASPEASGDSGGYQSPYAPPAGGYGNGAYGGGGGGGGKGGEFSADTMVQMIYDSGMLPGGGGKFQNPEATIYVAGLPGGCNNEHVYRLFACYGAIASIHVKTGGDGAREWSIAFINFYEPEAAANAIQAYHGMQLPNGLALKVVMKTVPGK